MKFQIYVIFHRTLHKDFYETIPEEMFRKNITCIGVNEKIPKSYDPWFESSVIQESQLENYNPLLQEKNYYESSAYIHIANSKIIDPYDYVGCLHYDMKITNNTLKHIQTSIDSSTNCLFYFDLGIGDVNIYNSFEQPFDLAESSLMSGMSGMTGMSGMSGIVIWGEIIVSYNSLFKTSFTISDILYGENTIPMFHSFIMPKHVLLSLEPFIASVSELILQLLEDKRTFPYHLERLWGICLILKKLEGVIPTWIKLTGIIHDESVKDAKNF